MAVNQSKKNDPNSWTKWRTSGALGSAPSIIERVESYVVQSRTIVLADMVQLSEVAVGTYDNYDEFDVYFDLSSYIVKNKKNWRTVEKDGRVSYLTKPVLRERGLGILGGAGSIVPGVRSFDDALEYAKRHLKPVTDRGNWYSGPKKLAFGKDFISVDFVGEVPRSN